MEDYKFFVNRDGANKRGSLLCCTFVKASLSPFPVLYSNIVTANDKCDWAIAVYDADNEFHVQKICETIIKPMALKSSSIVYCGQSELSYMNRTTTVRVKIGPHTYGSVTLNSTLPKSVQYSQFLPHVRHYERVFLLDEDLSVAGLNFTSLLHIWTCAFSPLPPPILVQPLIAESTQLFDYVNKNSWQYGGRQDIVASSVGLVEQQAPLIEARFFEWFVRRVLPLTRSVALKMGVDQGLDKTWCSAAKVYGKRVLNHSREFAPCALITAEAVHHLNTQSMREKRANLQAFKEKAKVVLSRYKDLFPNWVLTESRYYPDPMSLDYAHRYRTVSAVPSDCRSHPR